MNPERIGRAEVERGRLAKITTILAVVLTLLALAWALYVTLIVIITGQRDDAQPADAVVVLGAGEVWGWPEAELRARCDHALSLYEAGVAPLVVVAGGDPDGTVNTEADAGVRYLEYLGMPPEALLAADRGDNTYESLLEVEARTRGKEVKSVVLVSDRYHMFRSLEMARDLGLTAYGSPTTTGPIENEPVLLLDMTLREVVAYSAYALGVRNPTLAFGAA